MNIEIKRPTDKFWINTRKAFVKNKEFGAYLRQGDYAYLLDVDGYSTEQLDAVMGGGALQRVVSCQYELTDGSYVVVTDQSRDRLGEETGIGRLAINQTWLSVRSFDSDLNPRRRMWMVLIHVRWARRDDTIPSHAHIRPTLCVERVEEISPKLLALHLKTGKEIRIRFYKKKPKPVPIDWGGVYTGVAGEHIYPIPYRVYQRYRLGWRSWAEFRDSILNIVIGTPLRLWEFYPK